MQKKIKEKNIFAENLRKIRERAGVSRADAATAIGVSLRSFGAYERGETYPLAETLPKIAAALHCSIDELFGYSVNDFDKAVNFLVEQCNLGVYGIDKERIMISRTSRKPWFIFDSKEEFVEFVLSFKGWFTHSAVYEAVSQLAMQSILPAPATLSREERDKRDVRIIRCRMSDLAKKGVFFDDIVKEVTYINETMKKLFPQNKQNLPPEDEED